MSLVDLNSPIAVHNKGDRQRGDAADVPGQAGEVGVAEVGNQPQQLHAHQQPDPAPAEGKQTRQHPLSCSHDGCNRAGLAVKVIVDLFVVPIGVGVHLAPYIAACEKELTEAGLKIQLHPPLHHLESQYPHRQGSGQGEQAADVLAFWFGETRPRQWFAKDGDQRIGGYSDLAARLGVRAESADISYAPVVAVFLTAGLMALVLATGVGGFMGFAICLLAMLKLMDVEAFAGSFRKYDLLSQRWRPWGRLYPGIELLVGLGVLLQPQTIAAAQLLGAMAVLLSAMGMVSVGKAVFIDQLALNCACVGGNSKTPLGVVSFAENLIMAAMGAVMVAGR